MGIAMPFHCSLPTIFDRAAKRWHTRDVFEQHSHESTTGGSATTASDRLLIGRCSDDLRNSDDRAKNVKEIGLSAICGERKQMPRFDVSRWNYGNSM